MALLFLCFFSAIFSHGSLQAKLDDPKVPAGLQPFTWPEDNGYSPSRVELGKILFFDGRLSANGLVSCAFCHEPSHAFSGSTALSKGANGRWKCATHQPLSTAHGANRNFGMDARQHWSRK